MTHPAAPGGEVGTQHLVDEAELDGLVDDGSIDLPSRWRTTVRGPMPPSEELVRDGRAELP